MADTKQVFEVEFPGCDPLGTLYYGEREIVAEYMRLMYPSPTDQEATLTPTSVPVPVEVTNAMINTMQAARRDYQSARDVLRKMGAEE